MDKSALRAEIRARMGALTGAEREKSDEALFARFMALPEVERARTILLYYGMGAEPDTARLIPGLLAMGKAVALPKCLPGRQMEGRLVSNETALVCHPYGMLEPGEDCPVVSQAEIDLILTPGLAFDKKCYRLGQGGGYYDRYLADFTGRTVALCRDAFLLDTVPTQAHDRPVELVLTETREERALSSPLSRM